MNIQTAMHMPMFSKKTAKRDIETKNPLEIGLFAHILGRVREGWEEYRIMRDIHISEKEIAQGKARPIRTLIDLD